MYREHQPRIARYAQASPDGLAHVLQFVICSARMPLHRVPADLQEARAALFGTGPNASERSILFGWKHDAFSYAWRNREETYRQCLDIWEHGGRRREKADAMLTYVATLPGFNLAKAGFVLQLAFGLSGCLDTHNLQRLGCKPDNGQRSERMKRQTTRRGRLRCAMRYNARIYRLGGTAYLWDSWCAYVAAQQPRTYLDAEHVSMIHLQALGLED